MTEVTLSKTFTNDTAPSAYDVRLLVQAWDGEIHEERLNLDPAASLMFKSQMGLAAIDVDKLTSAHKVEDTLDDNATYYDFDSFSKVVTQEYNNALTGGVAIMNDLREKLYANSNDFSLNKPLEDITDINLVRANWNFVADELTGLVKSLENNGAGDDTSFYLLKQANMAIENLQNIGAIAEKMSDTWYGSVKPPGPGIEAENQINFNEFKVGFVNEDASSEPIKNIPDDPASPAEGQFKMK